MIRVVLDTNALFFPFQFKIDLGNEIGSLLGRCEILVPEVVIKELKGLSEAGKRDAITALRYAERFGVLPDESGLKGDSVVLAAAESVKGVLVTSDKDLIKRAKEKGLRVVFLRGRQKLELK